MAETWLPITLMICFLITLGLMIPKNHPGLNPRAAQALTQSGQVLILDVREPAETLGGHHSRCRNRGHADSGWAMFSGRN